MSRLDVVVVTEDKLSFDDLSGVAIGNPQACSVNSHSNPHGGQFSYLPFSIPEEFKGSDGKVNKEKVRSHVMGQLGDRVKGVRIDLVNSICL